MPSDNENQPVVLVDGSSYLFRAFHAMPPLTNSQGEPTGAIKGVLNMLRSLHQQYPDSKLIVVFDAKGKTFRHEQYAEYKANRPPMPDELRGQIEPLHQCIEAMGYPLLCVDGVEADDVIGTLSRQATDSGCPCVVSTGDKDMAQLVTSQVSLVNTMSQEYLDEQGVENKYGFRPELMIDYLALMGDKSDNIPGVPGVGDKTAKALIAGLGSLRSIYDNLDNIKDLDFRGAKTMAIKLAEHKDQAFLSYQLATIKCDVELPQSLQQIQPNQPDTDKLLSLYERLNFKSWIQEVSKEPEAQVNTRSPQPASGQASASHKDHSNQAEPSADQQAGNKPDQPDNTKVDIVISQDGLSQLTDMLKRSRQVAIIPVISGGHYMSHRPLGLAFCVQAGKACYLPLSNDHEDTPSLLDEHETMAVLKPYLESYDLLKSGHDIKKLRHQLNHYGISLSHADLDTWLLGFVYNSIQKRHPELDKHYEALSLDSLSRWHLDWPLKGFDEIAGPFGAKQKAALDIELEKIGSWAGQQADACFRLTQWFDQNLPGSDPLRKLYTAVEAPLIPVLKTIEQTGALIDTDYLNTLSEQFSERMAALESRAFEAAGEEFNLSSPKQLGRILFEKLNLPVIKKTATGQPSTNEEVLTELANNYELPHLLLEHRQLSKLVGTYTQPLPRLVNEMTGRVHTTYNQAGAATGRFASNDPNLQNIPVRRTEGRAIRKAFIAPDGQVLVAADYSQIELRIMTHLSQDKTLIQAFKEGKDIHLATAAEVMGIPESEVTNDQRRSAKAINFGLIYGMSAFGLARQLGISRGQAQEYVNTYFERYPGVKRYMDETRDLAGEKGYVETIFGRRLYLPDIRAGKAVLRNAAERTAINAPMQGTAADIIKRAMIDVQSWLDGSSMKAKMIMQVHDELVFEVPEDQVDEFVSGVKMRMQHAADLSVPLVVDVGTGKNWDEAH